MAAVRRADNRTQTAKVSSSKTKESLGETAREYLKSKNYDVIEEHLPPLPLIFAVLLCSGALFVLAARDFLSTGRNIAGSWDDAFLDFTKSTQWFEGSNGWKSTMGGFSAIQQVTTDKNNMGGFFVRKVAGAAAVAVHLQKLLPLLVHPTGSQWMMGHFRPLLWTALIGDLCVAAFYGAYLEDLKSAGAAQLPMWSMALLAFESLVFLFYLVKARRIKRGPASAMPAGKTPKSVTSRIVTRTVLIVSSVMALIAGRDLFYPGAILSFVPRDDIYLEWTNAFVHSPPEGSPESHDHGLEAPLHVGDKFMSQYMALHVLILCLYKYVTALFIRYGSDGSGEVKCRMIWKAQAIGGAMILFVFRVFTPSAASASLDLRWHLMTIAYETFIIGLYGFL